VIQLPIDIAVAHDAHCSAGAMVSARPRGQGNGQHQHARLGNGAQRPSADPMYGTPKAEGKLLGRPSALTAKQQQEAFTSWRVARGAGARLRHQQADHHAGPGRTGGCQSDGRMTF